MKSFIFFAYLLLCFFTGSTQSFEGKVIYKNTFKNNSPEVNGARLDSVHGNKNDPNTWVDKFMDSFSLNK